MKLYSQAFAPIVILVAIAVSALGAFGVAKYVQQKNQTPTTITIPVPQSSGSSDTTPKTIVVTPFIPQPTIPLPCQAASFLPGCTGYIQQQQNWLQYVQQQQAAQLQYLQTQQQLQQQQQYINPMANPQINPMANPNINPMANPQINPYANPQINPYANPQINPNYVPGQYTPQNLPPGYR